MLHAITVPYWGRPSSTGVTPVGTSRCWAPSGPDLATGSEPADLAEASTAKAPQPSPVGNAVYFNGSRLGAPNPLGELPEHPGSHPGKASAQPNLNSTRHPESPLKGEALPTWWVDPGWTPIHLSPSAATQAGRYPSAPLLERRRRSTETGNRPTSCLRREMGRTTPPPSSRRLPRSRERIRDGDGTLGPKREQPRRGFASALASSSSKSQIRARRAKRVGDVAPCSRQSLGEEAAFAATPAPAPMRTRGVRS